MAQEETSAIDERPSTWNGKFKAMTVQNAGRQRRGDRSPATSVVEAAVNHCFRPLIVRVLQCAPKALAVWPTSKPTATTIWLSNGSVLSQLAARNVLKPAMSVRKPRRPLFTKSLAICSSLAQRPYNHSRLGLSRS